MDFNVKLAQVNLEKFKRALSKGLRVSELPNLGKGSEQVVFGYENLVIKHRIRNKCGNGIKRKASQLLVQFSKQGMEKNLKFAPVLDLAESEGKILTISPFIEGIELADLTTEQLRDLGVDGMKQYLENNLALAGICLEPEYHSARNFKLSPQGNINAIDYVSWYFANSVKYNHPPIPYDCKDAAKGMEHVNMSACMLMLSVNKEKDSEITSNLHQAAKQIPNSKECCELLDSIEKSC